MDRAKKVVVIGDVFADMISKVRGFPETGGRTFGTSFMRNSGGTGGNIAAGLAVLGMEASIVCGLGDDENGEFLLEELKQSGVNTEHVKVTAGLKSGVVPIMVDEDGERVIYVLVKGSAFEAIEPEDLLFLEEMNPDALCFTGVIIGGIRWRSRPFWRQEDGRAGQSCILIRISAIRQTRFRKKSKKRQENWQICATWCLPGRQRCVRLAFLPRKGSAIL